MSFYGSQFTFDGIPCSDYDLMLYDIGSSNEDGKFASTKIIEDRIARRYTPLHYGITQNTPLSFSITIGLNAERIDNNKQLDRWEMETIASWLTGHDTYKYLEIVQPDMDIIRYKCIITNLESITYGKIPWAFKCEVTCDSPYAYMLPSNYLFTVDGIHNVKFHCPASCKCYYPKLNISLKSGNSFSVINHSDNGREFLFTNLPANPIDIYVDNENEIITNSKQLNLYDCFNFKFFRLVKGCNKLELKGTADVEFICEFPLNIGT